MVKLKKENNYCLVSLEQLTKLDELKLEARKGTECWDIIKLFTLFNVSQGGARNVIFSTL